MVKVINYKKNEAITLISLVITIVIMLIFATVAINLVLGDNGIFGKVKFSKMRYSESAAREEIENEILSYETGCVNDNRDFNVNELGLYLYSSENIKLEEPTKEELESKIQNSIIATQSEDEQVQNSILDEIKVSTKNYNDFIYTVDGTCVITKVKVAGYKEMTIEEWKQCKKLEKETSGEDPGEGVTPTEPVVTSTEPEPEPEPEPDTVPEDSPMDNIPDGMEESGDIIYSYVNAFNYNYGARVTYTTNQYGTSFCTATNGGYTGDTSPVGSTTGYWQASNGWNKQGAVENDDNKQTIGYNQNYVAKNASSATTMQGTTQQTMIIDPRAYYGDENSHRYTLDELYLASANSDGNVGNYSVYISNGTASNLKSNPNDSSWQLLTSGSLAGTDGSLVKVHSGTFTFRYIKIVASNYNAKGYFELAAIKGFKNYLKPSSITNAASPSINIFNYNRGARVTYTTNQYARQDFIEINGGFTGNSSAATNTSRYWKDVNGWDAQGAVENDDSKNGITYNHNNVTKTGSSATTMTGNGVTQTMIIDPRARIGDMSSNLYAMDELYLAPAYSDGNVGSYTIYTSESSDSSVATNPNDSSWQYLASGNLAGYEGRLVKIGINLRKFRYVKIVGASSGKSYFELAAIKGYLNTSIQNKVEGMYANVKTVNNALRINAYSEKCISGIVITYPDGTSKTINIHNAEYVRYNLDNAPKGTYNIKINPSSTYGVKNITYSVK